MVCAPATLVAFAKPVWLRLKSRYGPKIDDMVAQGTAAEHHPIAGIRFNVGVNGSLTAAATLGEFCLAMAPIGLLMIAPYEYAYPGSISSVGLSVTVARNV